MKTCGYFMKCKEGNLLHSASRWGMCSFSPVATSLTLFRFYSTKYLLLSAQFSGGSEYAGDFDHKMPFLNSVLFPISNMQGRIQSWTFAGLHCLFHMKSFLILLFAISNIAIWGAMAPRPPGSVDIEKST